MSTAKTIESKLQTRFAPAHLEVLDESHRHNVPRGAESHFRVTIVSGSFIDTPLLERHRSVNRALETELAGTIHALSIHAYTVEEWHAREGSPESPPCLGGEGTSGSGKA